MRYETVLAPLFALGAVAAPFQAAEQHHEGRSVASIQASATTDACAALVRSTFPTNSALFCAGWANGGTTQFVAPSFQTACASNYYSRISSVCSVIANPTVTVTTSAMTGVSAPVVTADPCLAQIKSSFPSNSALFCYGWAQGGTTQYIAPVFSTACSANNVYSRISSACTAINSSPAATSAKTSTPVATSVKTTSTSIATPTFTGDACTSLIKSTFPTNSALFCAGWAKGGTTQFVAPAFQTACASNYYSRISSACSVLVPSATSSVVLNTPTTTSRTTTSAPVTSAPAASTTAAASSSTAFSAPAAYTSAVLVAHNVHRANHSAPAITWSQPLAQIAADEASVCYFAHNVTGGGGGYGQNIAAGVTPNGIAVVISDLFYNGEVNWFAGNYGLANPNFTNFEHWGHFSQVVWKASTSVGCATIDCSAKGLGGVGSGVSPWFTVCNYEAPGNFGGQYGDNIGVPLNQSTVTGFYYA